MKNLKNESNILENNNEEIDKPVKLRKRRGSKKSLVSKNEEGDQCTPFYMDNTNNLNQPLNNTKKSVSFQLDEVKDDPDSAVELKSATDCEAAG